MERELFGRLYETAHALGRGRRTKHVVFPDWKVVVVYLWAAIHDRPTCWACRREHWPAAARGLDLPSPSTMSRRLRRVPVRRLLEAIETSLRRSLEPAGPVFIDSKPLVIGSSSKDPDARAGRANGVMAKGYKLHAMCDEDRVPVAWTLAPMNEHDSAVAPTLIGRLSGRGTVVGDNAYDVNRLYDTAGEIGWQLAAPRRDGTRLGKMRHSPWRLRVHEEMGEAEREELFERRKVIERFFGGLGNLGCGLAPLPNWVRRRRRVRLWVQAKILIYMAARLVGRLKRR